MLFFKTQQNFFPPDKGVLPSVHDPGKWVHSRATYELPPSEHDEVSAEHPLPPGLYTLGEHLFEIGAEEQAMIVHSTQLDQCVTLQKDELYRLLVVLRKLFGHATLMTSENKEQGGRKARRRC